MKSDVFIEYRILLEELRNDVSGDIIEFSCRLSLRICILKEVLYNPDLKSFSDNELKIALYSFCIGKSLAHNSKVFLGNLEPFLTMDRNELEQFIHQKHHSGLKQYADAYLNWVKDPNENGIPHF